MKTAAQNKLALTAADIARLGPSARAKLAAAGVLSKSGDPPKATRRARSAGTAERHYEVSWYAPVVGRRVTYDRPVKAATKEGAIKEVRAWLRGRAFREHKGVTNFMAVQRNPSHRGKAAGARVAAKLPRRTNTPKSPSKTSARRTNTPKSPSKTSARRTNTANKQTKLTPQQLAHLRSEFAKLDAVDLDTHRGKFHEVFAGVRTSLLKQLALANIQWVSPLAKNAYMRRLRNPARNPMHPLEVGSHVAIIMSGLKEVREMLARSKKKAKAPQRNLGLISLVENLQAADWIASKVGGKKKRNTPEQLVTPQLARRWLNTNKNRHDMVKGRVLSLAKAMRAGTFKAKSPLVFKNGKLLDGRHRLFAVVVSGKAVRFPIERVRTEHRQRNRSTGKIFEEFTGNKSEFIETGYVAPPGTPKNIDELGKLTELHVSQPGEGLDLSRCGRGGPCNCGRVIRFHSNPAKLCVTQKGNGPRRFVIALKQPYTTPRQLNPNEPHDYGEVHVLCYRGRKLHENGHNRLVNYYHELGDEGGRKPRLILHNGMLRLQGGDMTVKGAWLRN